MAEPEDVAVVLPPLLANPAVVENADPPAAEAVPQELNPNNQAQIEAQPVQVAQNQAPIQVRL